MGIREIKKVAEEKGLSWCGGDTECGLLYQGAKAIAARHCACMLRASEQGSSHQDEKELKELRDVHTDLGIFGKEKKKKGRRGRVSEKGQ